MAITASTLTTICIFFPVLFIKGVTRIIFSTFAVVAIVVFAGSLFSALTLTPMLSSTVMGGLESRRRRSALFRASERVFEALAEGYGRLLGWALRHRAVIVFAALVLFVSSILFVPFLGHEFFPEEDRGMLQGTIHLAPGTRVEQTAKAMQAIENIVKEEVGSDELIALFGWCGQSRRAIRSAMGEEGSHIGGFGFKLVPSDERRRSVKQIADALRKRIDAAAGALHIAKYNLDTGDPMSGMLLGGEKPLTINIIGEDMKATDELAEKIRAIAQNTPGAVDVNISRVKGKPELWVKIDRDKASSMGLNVYQIAHLIRSSFYGKQASTYRVRGEDYDIFVRMRKQDRALARDILSTPIRLPTGALVPLENIASVQSERGPLEIERKDQGRVVNVQGNVSGRSLGEVANEIEKKVKKLDIPAGIEVKMAGQTEEQRKAFFWLGLALAVGVVLVYMVMASQFESLIHPFVVMFSVPFAFTGVIWATILRGYTVSVVTFIGLLLLVGIVVNNAIVLVDYTNILRARGLAIADAVRQAGKTRLRPVLMTALTTVFALLPMAFRKGEGAEVWNPLGTVVIAGLLASTLITLVLVPVMYSVLERERER